MRSLKRPLSVAALVLCAVPLDPARAVPGDDEIREILRERVGEQADRTGIVVGVIEPDGRRIVAYGSAGAGADRPLDGDAVFEIGSVTKVFTALLLADMAEGGEIGLDDPVERYLPDGVNVPERGGRSITLRELALHHSGLPRLPGNMDPADPTNPYADYSVEQLYAFLSSHELQRDIGAQYEYSNLGYGLLGHALARAAGVDYETLVRERIAEPLGMASTAATLNRDLRSRLATGHDVRRRETSNWDLPTLPGAGALKSTANDLLSFLALFLGQHDEPLEDPLSVMLTERRPAGPGMEIALGWHIRQRADDEGIVWHDGGTGGYRSFVGLDPAAGAGVVVLTNVSTPAGVNDIGLHLLDATLPLLPADSPLLETPRERTRITLEPEALDPLVGRYAFGPGIEMTVTREGNRLFVTPTGQPRTEVFPESATRFFFDAVDADIEFRTDEQGRVHSLVVTQLGTAQVARKLDSDADEPEEWFGYRVADVDPAIYDGYVGQYRLTPALTFTITRDGDSLFAQLTGQPRVEIFPASEVLFFYKVVDAQITFEPDESGRANALVLHQAGQNPRAERID